MIPFLIILALGQVQTVPSGDSSTSETPATLLIHEVQRIGARVEALRAESFDRPLDAVRVPDDIREAAAEIRALNVLPRERLQARGRAWSDLGLGGADAARNLLLTLAADLDDIGLDPQGRQLLVSVDRLHPEDFEPTSRPDDPATVLLLTGMRPDEPLVCHLLAHVRQRERSGRDALEETTDRLLASMAWAEGEANLMAVRYLFEEIGVGTDVLTLMQDPGDVLGGSLLPPNLHRLRGVEVSFVTFVYLEGYNQAVKLYRAGGWEALSRGMAERRTTRDLLHPKLPALPPADFPASPAPPTEGVRLADTDTLGEQGIVVLVSALTGKDSLGLQAGEGWAGDRLYRWEPDKGSGEGGTEWVTRWTASGTEVPRSADQTAADFAYAFGRTLEARFPGQALETPTDGVRTLTTGERVYRIERSGAEVRVRVEPLAWSPPAGQPGGDP